MGTLFLQGKDKWTSICMILLLVSICSIFTEKMKTIEIMIIMVTSSSQEFNLSRMMS
jgi:hypothetical protein